MEPQLFKEGLSIDNATDTLRSETDINKLKYMKFELGKMFFCRVTEAILERELIIEGAF